MHDFQPATGWEADPVFPGACDMLPDIPTMSTTRLQLDLLLQESPIDLAAVSAVVLSDVGATLQILRLVGEEFTSDEGRPTRMEDCLASLSLERCYQAVAACSLAQDDLMLVEWQRLRRVAECARNLAEWTRGVSPTEAYLVGLLSEVGRLPELLGWGKPTRTTSEQVKVGVMLVEHWNLPCYLTSAIRGQHEESFNCPWSGFLTMAKRLAEADISASDCVMSLATTGSGESALEGLESRERASLPGLSPAS
jgi:HD-like signal output (HDOD) protein